MRELLKFIDENYGIGESQNGKNRGVFINKIDHAKEFNFSLSEPCLCLCLRGEKHFYINEKCYIQNTKDFVLTATTLPINAQILATQTSPYTSVRIDLDEELIKGVLSRLKHSAKSGCYCGLKFEKSSERIRVVVDRLVRDEMDDFVLNLALQELVYALAISGCAEFLHTFVSESGAGFSVTWALNYMRQNYASKLKVSTLANLVGLSERSFYEKFKSVTGLTPVGFVRLLRLREARELLKQGKSATVAAMSVGYESVSHFSRDYSKFYGASPKAHASFLRA